MKTKIKGIIYNTETALEIQSRNNYDTVGHGDIDSYEETLYNEDGRYFIYQTGGARTIAANNTPTGGKQAAAHIIPITEKEVKIWRESGLYGVYMTRPI